MGYRRQELEVSALKSGECRESIFERAYRVHVAHITGIDKSARLEKGYLLLILYIVNA
jgi:hypothetical protein